VRVAFLNVQSGVGVTRGYWHYALRAHRYLVPHDDGIVTQLAELAARERLDALACAEIEGRSFRSRNIDYVTALAQSSSLGHARFFGTQKLGRFVNQGNSVHSAAPLAATVEHVLPGGSERRVLGEARLDGAAPLTLFVTHLSLGKRARAQQLEHIARVVQGKPRALLVGDFNTSDATELAPLAAAGLRRCPTEPTYPSWRPTQAIDHVLAGQDVRVRSVRVDANVRLGDHLPIVVELER
jgi:endonuclease/exonuclease/phosphatase family metal-dependent hydrolase